MFSRPEQLSRRAFPINRVCDTVAVRHITGGSLMFRVPQALGRMALVLALAMLSAPASAQRKDVKMMLDWVMQGTHAPFFVAQEKGYYKEGGLNVTVEAGKGATNVAVIVASGTFDFGWV